MGPRAPLDHDILKLTHVGPRDSLEHAGNFWLWQRNEHMLPSVMKPGATRLLHDYVSFVMVSIFPVLSMHTWGILRLCTIRAGAGHGIHARVYPAKRKTQVTELCLAGQLPCMSPHHVLGACLLVRYTSKKAAKHAQLSCIHLS